MENRRTFLGIAAASLLPTGLQAQAPAPPRRGEIARHALTGPFEGHDALLVEIDLRPNVMSAAHQHTGPVLGYVLEGRMRFGINNEPERIVPTGGAFFEPSGAVHTTAGSAIPDAGGRILVFAIVPKGSPLTAPR